MTEDVAGVTAGSFSFRAMVERETALGREGLMVLFVFVDSLISAVSLSG